MYPKCPVCGNAEEEKISFVEENHEVNRIQCMICECIYFDQDPPYTPTYDEKYNMHFYKPADIRKAGIIAADIADMAFRWWKKPKILEVGPGNGISAFLIQVMGIQIEGIDMSREWCLYLRKNFALQMHCEKFENFTSAARYHIIYSSDVLEHSPDPYKFFLKAYEHLDDEGIFLLYTPDTFFWQSEKPRWHHFATRDPYEHVIIHSVKSIHILAEETGFSYTDIQRLPQFGKLEAKIYR